jgi:hypothetical protein
MDETPKRWLSRASTRAKRTLSVKKFIRQVSKTEDERLTGLDSGEYDFLCNICTRLLTIPASQKKLFSKSGFSRDSKLYHDEGCRFCQQIVEVIRARGFPESMDLSHCTLHAVDKNRRYIYEFQDHGFGYGVGSEEKTSGPGELTQLAFLQVRVGLGDLTDINLQPLLLIAPCFSRLDRFKLPAALTNSASDDITESMFTSPNPPIHDFELSGDFLVRRARALIRDCRKNHVQCKASSPRLPKRVIDVNSSGDGSNVRLHITGRHEKMTYLALSYCWGGDQKVTTTSRNLGSNLISIPKSSLDLTIQDAISMTRKLGFHYLWVDSLCIIQDDADDKEKEIQVMDEIYRNATLTIAAAATKSVREGFLRSSKASSLESRHKLPLRLPDGQMGFITAIAEKTVRGQTGWALDTRAWALQELILSRRVLVFADGDVRFQCQKTDLEAVVPNHIVYPNHIERLPMRHQDLQTFLKVKWYDLIEAYTHRALTDENDRLIAISGIVKLIQGRMRADVDIDEYFAGMWKSGLAGNLLWYTNMPLPLESNETRSASSNPSFSWASLGSGVNFLGVLTSSLDFIKWGVRVEDFGGLGGSTSRQFSMLTVKAWVLPLSKLLLEHLPRLCRCDAITLEDLKCVLHVWGDYEGREGFEILDSSVLLRVDDGANSKDHRGLIINHSKGKYFRRVGVYSELDRNSRPKKTEVDPTKMVLIETLRKVLSTPVAWDGYSRAEITLV